MYREGFGHAVRDSYPLLLIQSSLKERVSPTVSLEQSGAVHKSLLSSKAVTPVQFHNSLYISYCSPALWPCAEINPGP